MILTDVSKLCYCIRYDLFSLFPWLVSNKKRKNIYIFTKSISFYKSFLFRHQDHNSREWLIFNATQVWFGLRVDLILAFFSVIVIFTSILLHNSTGKLTVTLFNSNTKDIAFVFTRNTLQFLVFTIALKKTKACTQKRDLHVIRDERLQFKADRVAMAICFGYLAGFIILS